MSLKGIDYSCVVLKYNQEFKSVIVVSVVPSRFYENKGNVELDLLVALNSPYW